jgi:hypothetical protein
MLTMIEQMTLCDKAAADAAMWHAANFKEESRIKDYDAGFRDGWRQAIRAVRRSGYDIPDPPAK